MTGAFPTIDGIGIAHRYVTVDGLRLHYAEAGEGEPLVLLHGWPQHWWCWRHLIGPLAERYRVICPDWRGMGWSEGSRDGYTWQGMARDLVDLLDQIVVEDFRLVGHDWGLVVGYRAVFNWPERIRRFVAIGGVHLWAPDGGPSIRLGVAAWHVYLIALLGDVASHQLGVTARCLRAWRHNGQFSDEALETYMSVMRQPKCLNATKRFDRNVVLREVPHFLVHHRHIRDRVRTLHLNGDHDPLVPWLPDSYRNYADDMRLELVPNCGHFVAEEQPEWLLERLGDFL